MILDRYIFKELLKSQVVVLIVLISIFAAQSLIRLITDAASGDMPAALILQFLIYSLPEFLSLLLPLTLYVSLIITLGRICSDSEMVVMRAIGFSPKRIMSIALLLASVSAVAAGYIGLVLTPKAALALQELQVQAVQNPEFLPIDSGRFVSFGRYNIYVEDVQGLGRNDKQVNNVFVIDSANPEELSITVARKGHMVIDDEGIRWLVLNDGRRYENPSSGTYRVGNFEQFKAPLSGNVTEASTTSSKLNTRSSYELFTSSDINAQIEFQWRFAPVFAVIVMCMVAVPLSMVNPRQGRFTRLMPAIIIYAAYYLFLMSLRNMVRTGSMPLYPGLYLVPLSFLILVAIPLNLPKTYLKHIRRGQKATQIQAGIVQIQSDSVQSQTSSAQTHIENIKGHTGSTKIQTGSKSSVTQSQLLENRGQDREQDVAAEIQEQQTDDVQSKSLDFQTVDNNDSNNSSDVSTLQLDNTSHELKIEHLSASKDKNGD